MTSKSNVSLTELDDRIAEASAVLAELEAERAKFLQLSTLYPDLHTYAGTSGRVFQSEKANHQVTEVEFHFGCGCCEDVALNVSLYVNTPFGRVYSYPAVFYVGRRIWGDLEPTSGWEENLRRFNVPEAVIERIRRHFEEDERERLKSEDDERRRDSDDSVGLLR